MSSGFWTSVLTRFAPAPSKELQAVANRLNRMDGEVRVSAKGAVYMATDSILHDPEFKKACEEAKTAVYNRTA
jgi:hypothetical protein